MWGLSHIYKPCIYLVWICNSERVFLPLYIWKNKNTNITYTKYTIWIISGMNQARFCSSEASWWASGTHDQHISAPELAEHPPTRSCWIHPLNNLFISCPLARLFSKILTGTTQRGAPDKAFWYLARYRVCQTCRIVEKHQAEYYPARYLIFFI
jgi:hypothetical protein